MAKWLKMSTCRGNAATVCCPYGLDSYGTAYGPDYYYTAHDETISGLCFPASKNINISMFAFYLVRNEILIIANGVTIYDSGWFLEGLSVTVTIPAGTTTLRYLILGQGNSPPDADQWSITLTCA